MSSSDGDLVHPDHLRRRLASPVDLGLHVLALQRLDRVPVELELARHLADRRLPTASTDVPGEALDIERIACQKVEPLGPHLAASAAIDSPELQLQPNPRVATGQVVHLPRLAVVPARPRASAAATNRFFPRRTSVTTPANGSPNTPRTVAEGRHPGNRYASSRRRRRGVGKAMRTACQTFGHPADAQSAFFQAL
jgi:hypothetical protein